MTQLIIKLGTETFTIQPLTIGQLRDLHVGVSEPVAQGTADIWERNLRFILLALSVDHPEITADSLSKLRGVTWEQIVAAVKDILKFSGLVKSDSPPGEAPAEAA